MTQDKHIHYEVCTDNVYGSDVLQFDTLKEAKKAAKIKADQAKRDAKKVVKELNEKGLDGMIHEDMDAE